MTKMNKVVSETLLKVEDGRSRLHVYAYYIEANLVEHAQHQHL